MFAKVLKANPQGINQYSGRSSTEKAASVPLDTSWLTTGTRAKPQPQSFESVGSRVVGLYQPSVSVGKTERPSHLANELGMVK